MPYKDREKQLAFQNHFMRKRRDEYLRANGPCECGATESLTLLKRKAGSNASSHVWSLTEKRRAAALSRYLVCCRPCAKKERSARLRERYLGKPGTAGALHLNHSDVWAIRGRLLGKETIREISRAYGLNHRTICDIKVGKIWRWLEQGRRQVYGVHRVPQAAAAADRR
jgi:hypothetical protein